MSDWVKCSKAILLINLKPGLSREDFTPVFTSERLDQTTDTGDVHASRAVRIDETEIGGLPHQVLMADSPAPFDAAYQLRSADTGGLQGLSDGIVEVVKQLDKWLDRERSALLVGTEVAITRGGGPIEIIMPLRRVPHQTHDEFMENWYGRHASIGEAVDGVRYRQNHVDTEATRCLSARTGIEFEPLDGITESFFDSAEDAINIMSRQEVAVDAIEDEKQFIDHSRSHFGFYRIYE